jgi:very-short-patch-repair endonuclease
VAKPEKQERSIVTNSEGSIPISTYIVDFYCHEAKLVIEVDGGIHFIDDNPEYDKFRTLQLEAFGLKGDSV